MADGDSETAAGDTDDDEAAAGVGFPTDISDRGILMRTAMAGGPAEVLTATAAMPTTAVSVIGVLLIDWPACAAGSATRSGTTRGPARTLTFGRANAARAVMVAGVGFPPAPTCGTARPTATADRMVAGPAATSTSGRTTAPTWPALPARPPH